MQDAIAGFQSAPVWAQIAMVLFAAMVVVAIVGPTVRRRKFRRHFDAIARGLDQPPSSNRELPVGISGTRRRPRLRGQARSPKHEQGQLVSRTDRTPVDHGTRLTSNRWSLHQVDISKPGRLGLWLARGKRPTGDTDFDARFLVVEDGLPARDGWLDAATRKAVAQFLDEAPLPA